MAKIVCPKCSTESIFSLAQPTYDGPYRCMKCKEIFKVKIENDEVKSYQLINQQEISKLDLKNRYINK